MPTTKSGITYSISCKGGAQNPTERKETWAAGGNQAYEVVRLQWQDWPQFVLDMVGNAFWIPQPGGAGGYQLTRNLPTAHPVWPWMIAVRVELLEMPAVIGATGGFASFNGGDAVVAGVTFESVPYDIADDATAWASYELVRYVERPFKVAVENLTVKGVQLAFDDTNGHIGTEPALIFPAMDRMYVWRRVPADPVTKQFPLTLEANILATMGRVNLFRFDNHPAGTLLCGAPEVTEERGPTGAKEFTIKYPLAKRPSSPTTTTPWNSKMRFTNAAGQTTVGGVDQGGFYSVHVVQTLLTGNVLCGPPYKSADFNKLFQNA